MDLRAFYAELTDIEMRRQCAWLERCCANEERLRDDLARCRPGANDEFIARWAREAEERRRAGHIRVDLSRARACLDAVRAATRPIEAACGDVENFQRAQPNWEYELPECRAFMDGTLPAGAVCDSLDQSCARGLICHGTGSLSDPNARGVCTAPLNEGDPCPRAAVLCPRGTLGFSGRCLRRVRENAECDAVLNDCDFGLFCQAEGMASRGVCRPLLGTGGRCRRDPDCRSLACVEERCAAVCGAI